MKKIVIFIVALVLSALVIYCYSGNNKVDFEVKLQVIQFDIIDNSETLVKEISVKSGDIISLSEFNGNDIKILEINENSVTISRDARRYEILNQNSMVSGVVREYTETVIEKLKYGVSTSININSHNPLGPDYAQARHHYSVQFIKY